MSYDIIIIDRPKRFQNCLEFWKWYVPAVDKQQGDYRYSSPTLRRWFLKYKDSVRPMNGEFAPSEDDYGMGEYQEADYGFGKDFIYVALAYSDAAKASRLAFALAEEFHLAYYDNSGMGRVRNADGSSFALPQQKAAFDAIVKECQKETKRRKLISQGIGFISCLLLLLCFLYSYSFLGLNACSYVFVAGMVCIISAGKEADRWIENVNQEVLKDYPNYQLQEKPSVVAEPAPLLADIAWNFRLGQFESKKDFYEAVVKYNEEVQNRDVKSLLNSKIECIGKEATFELFDEYSEEAENKPTNKVHLTCDDGHAFTGVEVLFKLNAILYPLLEDSDTTYFEGFQCLRQKDHPTICHLLLGS